nr:cbb3-type cytochrome c oxidase subunit I [Xylophilus rhododendri]
MSPAPPPLAPSYLDDGVTLWSWLSSVDHKRIGILYAIAITAFFFIGGAAATLIRLELATPAGDLVSNDTYNKLFTVHGVVMVWLFLIPSIPSVVGNFVLPLMIGARDLAFPRLNLLSWYLYVIGGLVTLWALFLGGVDTGWTFYTPYSTMFSNGYVVLTLTGIFITGFSSILTGLNFITSVHLLRVPGMGWFKLPLLVWSLYATSIILVLATPVLAITALLTIAERLFHIGVFDPSHGGDPLLFQHLFWFYSHPAVYIMVLPAMGVVSEIIPCFAKKRIFGYRFMAYAVLGIAALGFLVWGTTCSSAASHRRPAWCSRC